MPPLLYLVNERRFALSISFDRALSHDYFPFFSQPLDDHNRSVTPTPGDVHLIQTLHQNLETVPGITLSWVVSGVPYVDKMNDSSSECSMDSGYWNIALNIKSIISHVFPWMHLVYLTHKAVIRPVRAEDMGNFLCKWSAYSRMYLISQVLHHQLRYRMAWASATLSKEW